MKKTAALLLCALSAPAWAVKLSDYRPYSFEVLFTNPVCATYKYDRPLTTESGNTVTSKPKNVYCKLGDEKASVSRRTSPQYRIVEWIHHPSTKEIYMAYLSFSSRNVRDALCTAAKKGVKISLVLDSGEDGSTPVLNEDAELLKKFSPKKLVNVYYRGSTPGLGYAHNKIMMMNPGTASVGIVFSSGNMSSGTSINHENWNFVITSGQSYFAQAHKCVVEAMIRSGDTKAKFAKDLNTCRSQITARPESDIQIYFSPVDGAAALQRVTEAGMRAGGIKAMSHRFSGQLATLYKELLARRKPIRFILDDDIYWAAKRKEDIGRNTSSEAGKIYRDLINKGMDTRFLQTNQNIFQLQHNKFMIFGFGNTGAVFNGAGNFTTAAFTKNFENFYFITIPEVVKAYNQQYDYYFEQLATPGSEMPRDYLLP